MTLETAKQKVKEHFNQTNEGRKFEQVVRVKFWGAVEAGLCNNETTCTFKGKNPSMG